MNYRTVIQRVFLKSRHISYKIWKIARLKIVINFNFFIKRVFWENIFINFKYFYCKTRIVFVKNIFINIVFFIVCWKCSIHSVTFDILKKSVFGHFWVHFQAYIADLFLRTRFSAIYRLKIWFFHIMKVPFLMFFF